MGNSNITIKEILEKRLGKDVAVKVLNEINKAVLAGKQGEELETLFNDLLKREGLDPGDIQLTTTHVVPTS